MGSRDHSYTSTYWHNDSSTIHLSNNVTFIVYCRHVYIGHKQMKLTTGDYMKAEGADWGAYWNGKIWVYFQCVGCEYARGNAKKRIQNSKRVKLGKWNQEHTHNKELHNQWIQSGKPVTK